MAALTIALLFSAGLVQSAGQPADLAGAIQRFHAGAAVVRPADVDASSCGPLGKSPGLVATDLNGDGRQDYGVLLMLKHTGKETPWQGKVLREAQFAFVMFVGGAGGDLTPRVVQRYTEYVPSSVVIELEAAGIVRHRETGKDVRLTHPGLLMSFCEKSGAIYYLAGNRLRSISRLRLRKTRKSWIVPLRTSEASAPLPRRVAPRPYRGWELSRGPFDSPLVRCARSGQALPRGAKSARGPRFTPTVVHSRRSNINDGRAGPTARSEESARPLPRGAQGARGPYRAEHRERAALPRLGTEPRP